MFKVGNKVIVKYSPFINLKINEICTIKKIKDIIYEGNKKTIYRCTTNGKDIFPLFFEEIELTKSEILKQILEEDV